MGAESSISTTEAGRQGEEIARRYLRSRGITILASNFRYGRAEVDIIARDSGVLVFCEVKMRQNDRFGLPEESVTPRKQRQIHKAALGYLAAKDMDGQICRFDVLAIEKKGMSVEVRHWKNAF
jgi:putative endonuclease